MIKTFTKQNFKTNPLWIRLLIMIFMLLIGTGSAWAVNNVSGGYIYFDNSTTKWTDSSIQFVIGHNSYSRTYVMKKLSNSNVYYYKLDDATYHDWNDATYYAFIGTGSKWGDGNWGSSNLSNATHRTAAYTSTYNLNSGSTYCFTPSSSSNGASLTITTSYPNTTNRAYVYAVSNGSAEATSKAAAGTVNVAGYYISSQGTTSSRSATSSASTYSASNTFVRGTTITMSVVSTGSGYTFKGWYSSSTASSGNLLGTSTSYTYTSSGSSTKTVYAVFEANPTVVISETGGTGIVKLGSATLSTSATSMASGSYELSIEAPANYNVSSVSVDGGSLTTEDTTGSSIYIGTVNVSANTTINITYEQACTPPDVQISNPSSTTLCTGGSLTFTYTAAAGAKVTFKMGTNSSSFDVTGDGSDSGTVTITYNSTTSINSNAIKYDVSGTGICPLTDQSTGKTIKCGPVPSIAATSATSFSFCPGDDAVTLSVTAGQGTYKWAKDGEVIAGKTTHSIEVNEAGTYTVFVVGTGGCQSNTVTFNVNGNGGPRVYASGSTTLGANKFAALYVTDCSGKEIKTYQWQSSSTQNGTYTDYAASVTNSGTLYSGDAGTTNNIRPATDGWYRCKVTYTDGSSLTSEAKQVTGTFTRLSSTLPVIIVNTNGVGFPVNNFGGTPSKNANEMKAKRSVDVKIYQGNTMVYDRKARMNYRGSSSLNFLKKSYAFCPGKDNCVEDKGRLDYVKTEKMNMLGIGTAKDKDWVLYAAAADPSLMRNRLMFDTFRDMTGGWSVNSRYVELYVDGEYKGVYVMMDKVTKNEGRVNISENGFIVKFDKTDLADRYEADGDKKTFKSLYSGYDGESGNGMKTYDTYIDQRFEIEYPEMEDVEEDNPGMWAKTVNDIKTLFNNFESNLKAGNYAEVQKIIDYTSWADWFIISEYAKNMDAYRASCLFVYDGGKIEARPLWDQELSFSNQCANLCATYGCNSTEGLLIENDKIYEEGCAAPFWFTGKYVGGRGTEAKDDAQFEGYLLNDPCFIAVLKERWALHTAAGGALTKEELKNKLDVYLAELDNQHQWGSTTIHSGTPLYREFYDFWGNNSYSNKSRTTIDCGTGSGCFDGTTGYQDLGFHNSKVTMYNWTQGANDRRTRLGDIINDMEGSPLSISFEPQQITTTPWEPITLQVVNTSSYDYTITYTDGELDKQSGVIINKTDDTFKINVPRPDKWGIGNEKVVDERADITYGIKATLNVADGTTVCGNSEVTPATATIILQDEPNEDCPQ